MRLGRGRATGRQPGFQSCIAIALVVQKLLMFAQVCAAIVRLGSSPAAGAPLDDDSADRISAALQVRMSHLYASSPVLLAGAALR